VRLVFLSSPLVGPGTWRAAADAASDLGHEVRVVDLRGVVSARGPDMDVALRAMKATLGPSGLDAPGSVILVPHSGAGLLVPWIIECLQIVSVATVFVDAGLPDGGVSSVVVADPALRDQLRPLADENGILPPWSGWWDPGALDALVPDPRRRRALEEEMPPIPIGYLEGSVPIPAGWPHVPGAFLAFGGEAYASEARRARAWGWPVSVIEGAGHLHMAADPENVAQEIVSLAEALLD
jgi:pimeloyl-ACP methyl ester carboxylesterase